ncbi:hypothetical protein D3C80_757760 [compost metagenome]
MVRVQGLVGIVVLPVSCGVPYFYIELLDRVFVRYLAHGLASYHRFWRYQVGIALRRIVVSANLV